MDYTDISTDDVDDLLRDLNTRLATVEETPPPDIVSGISEIDVRFGPSDSKSTTTSSTLGSDINAVARHLLATKRGGDILIDGEGTRQFLNQPLENRGVRIHTAGGVAPAGHTRTRLQPLFSDDAQLKLFPPVEGSGVQHWRSGSYENITLINPLNRTGLTSLQIVGGNWAPVRRIAQQHNVHTHVEVTEGHLASGQYSTVEEFFGWSARYGLVKQRGPDIEWVRCVWYGANQTSSSPHFAQPGSIGVWLKDGDSDTFTKCRVQFHERPWVINSRHVDVDGGATELGQYWPLGQSGPLITLGGHADWVGFDRHSFAHVNKGQRLALDVTDAAKHVRFELIKPFGLPDNAVTIPDWAITPMNRR